MGLTTLDMRSLGLNNAFVLHARLRDLNQTHRNMEKRRNNSRSASTLQIALSTGLISISAILLVIGAPTQTRNTRRHDRDSIMALGNYPNASALLSADTTVTPESGPTNTTSINVSTSTNFMGTLGADPTTGVVRVTDAHPAGIHTITVTAFDDLGPTATATFTLTVTTPVTCVPVHFAAATNIRALFFPVSVAVGDFNGDGKQDLVVVNFGTAPPHSTPGGVFILLGNGAGNFSVTNFPFGSVWQPQSVAVGDFNGDGKQDLALGITDAVSILLGDGAGNFPTATDFNVGTGPVSAAVGDFNRDGRQDLVVTNSFSNTVSILSGDGAGHFSGPSDFAAGTNPSSAAVGDFNGDGKQDLAVPNAGSSNVSILLGDGAGHFSGPTDFGTGNDPISVAVGDFNGDGKQDLAVANYDSNNVSILLGKGDGSFTAATNFDAGSNVASVAVGDFNGDGKQDLAVASNTTAASVSILSGDGVGNFSAPISFATDSYSGSVAVGDWNGDGKQDLALANSFGGSVSILLRDCAVTPTPTPTLTPLPTATATATATPGATATATPGPGPSSTPSATPAAEPLNLSTRMLVQAGDNVGIGGFIITGSAPKHVLLRAIGPSLANLGVPNPLADPILELHGPPGFVTIVNDNWRDSNCVSDICIGCGTAPPNDLESTICATLDPGPYTAIIRGTNNGTGVALVEAYDLDQAAASKLANISTRAFVSTGSDIVIAGFILGGNRGNDNVILRGIGPSLIAFGLPNALANPTLELRDSNGALIRANDNWADDPAQAALISAAGLAPTHTLESAVAMTLPPGLYTALLAGLNGSTGVGLVEVYDRGTP